MRINVFKSGGNSAQGGFVSNGLTLQGPLILSGPHTEPLHAVPKQYVDNAAYNLDANNITSGTLAAARLPAFTGDATTILGSSNIILASTGVTPGSIVKPTVDAKGRITSSGSIIESDISGIGFNKFTVGRPSTLDGYGITDAVHVSGNVTMTGQLIQSADPVNLDHAVTKQYVDSAAGLAGGISIGDVIRKPYSTTPTGFLKCNGAEVDKTTYANLYSVIGDTFAGDLTPGCGKPWQLQYAFNKAQTADVLGWTIGTPLPSVLCHTTAVVTKNRVYVLGGYNGSAYTSTVYTAPINADGTLGTWATGTALPLGLIASSGFVVNNKIYLVGGATGTGTYLSNVYYATINSDGTIGAWNSAPSLPGLLGYTKVIVTKKRVYTLAGNNGSIAISTIYTAAINDDGTLGTWSAHGSLPYSGYLCYTAVIKDRLYVIGGYSNGYRRDVYYANIDNDGVIGAWNPGIFLPKGMSHGECFTTENKIHITFTNEVYTAPIYSDGSLGTWYKSATLPYDMGETECVITNSKVYLISAATASYNAYVVYADFTGGSNDYSSYYGQTSDTTVNYLMPGSGRPWQQQYEINNTQTGDITGWSTGTALPAALGFSATIVTKNRVYVLGGYTNALVIVNTVYTAPINTDGTLGAWTTGAALPSAIAVQQAIVYKNRVYMLGGTPNGTNAVSSIYTAPINADGTLGTWTLNASALPSSLSNHNAILIRDKLYVLGGYTGSAYVNTVYYTTINSDGSLGTWITTNALPWAIGDHQTVVTKNRIYVLGGWNGSASSTQIATAAINNDGTIGLWTIISTTLPSGMSHTQVLVSKNYLYILGGYSTSASFATVYRAAIASDGTLGTWVAGSSIPYVLNGHSAFATNNKLYVIGGRIDGSNSGKWFGYTASATIAEGLNDYSPYYDGTIDTPDTTVNYLMPGSGRPWQQQYQINSIQSADITGWTTGTSLPTPLWQSQSVVTKNRVYLLGGNNNTVATSIIYSSVINSDGTLAGWVADGNIPIALNSSSVVVTKNRVYLLGGGNSTNIYSTTYSAPINSDGTLGSWTAGTSLPGMLQLSQAIVTKNRVYLMGGHNSSYISTVYTAPINSDGTIGAWTTNTSLPGAMAWAQAIVTKNRVYLCGGYTGSYVSTVYTAPINSDGTLGTWATGTSLPGPISNSQAIVMKNRVYLLGGFNGSAYVSTVYTASINSDGTLGTWTTGTALPGSLGLSQAIIVKNNVYLFGGASGAGTVVSTVYKATIAEGLNDYSPYYDGTIQPVSTVSSKFKLPDYTLLDREFGEYVTSYIKY